MHQIRPRKCGQSPPVLCFFATKTIRIESGDTHESSKVVPCEGTILPLHGSVCGGLWTEQNRYHTSAHVAAGECELSMHVKYYHNRTESGNWGGGDWSDRHMHFDGGERSHGCDFNVFQYMVANAS
jgi:hypothetical protein